MSPQRGRWGCRPMTAWARSPTKPSAPWSGSCGRGAAPAGTAARGRSSPLTAAFLEDKLDPDLDLTLTKVHTLFVRHTGEAIPYRTLHRFCVQELGHNADRVTVRVEDCDPGSELQVDFGRMGLMFDPETSRRRVVWALIFTAAFSRHTFVWPTFSQSLADIIVGFEAAWDFFGGVFRVVIIDNIKAVVTDADGNQHPG
jgi:hypothetical protein